MEYLCHKWPRICSLVVNTSLSFPHSWLITGFVTRLKRRRVPPIEQKLPTIPKHRSSFPVLSGVRVIRSFVLCVCCFQIAVCTFVLFLLAIVLYIRHRYTNYDYPFGIFKLFLRKILDIVIQFRRVCVENKYIFLAVETIDQSILDDNINGSINICQHLKKWI